MVSRVTLSLLCAFAARASADVDFTPVEQTESLEGQPLTRTAYRHDSGFVSYNPPPGWTAQGSGPRLQLRSGDVTFTSAVIEERKLPANAALDGAALQSLQAELAATLPREAEQVQWEEPETNPVLLNRHETRRLTVSYAAFAHRFKVTLIVCNFARQQIRFRLDARAQDFDRQYDLFRRSLYTWQGLP